MLNKMERVPDSKDATHRPLSSHTAESTFADSAIDMDASISATTAEADESDLKLRDSKFSLPSSPEPVDQSLSDEMRHFTAVAWTLEQDCGISGKARQRIKKILVDLEKVLEKENEEVVKDEQSQPISLAGDEEQVDNRTVVEDEKPPLVDEDEDEWIDEAELVAVHENLSATVKSMRLRQQEQRHLHELTVHKLEIVAQRCLAQEQQLRELGRNFQEMKDENQNLGEANDQLKTMVAELESEATRKEVAVSAMTSAVAGLEGWLDSTQSPGDLSAPKSLHGRRQRVVVRGKGRFRGKYIVEEDQRNASAMYSPTGADSQELHDGVKAWLRGFRDVEEELRQSHTPRLRDQKGSHQIGGYVDDDDGWGDFQRPDTFVT